MITRGIWLAAVCFSLTAGVSSPVKAHCDDARALCNFAGLCIANNDHLKRVREGVANNNGSEIWGELQGCTGSKKLEDRGAGSCFDADYIAVGRAALQAHDGIKGACNQLPK
jgi:hypothetical protein